MFKFEIHRDLIDEKMRSHITYKRRKAVRGVIFHEGKLLMVRTSLGDYKFPGGGVDENEDEKYALLREIREETGYTDVTVGPRIGQAFEENIDIFDENAIFQMNSSYYICMLNSMKQVDQVLEQYEKDMHFTPEFVDIGEAYLNNQEILEGAGDQKLDSINMPISDWVDRETLALKEILESRVDKLLPVIYSCGQMMKNADRSVLSVDDKAGHANFVTNYDKMIQDELKKGLLSICKDAAFIGEEDEDDSDEDRLSKGLAFIVDPIDGTTNFMKDYGQSCISVGITFEGEQVGGIVYQPYSDEMNVAELGKGAFCNGERIHVSDCDLEHSLVVFGTAPYYDDIRKESFKKAEAFCDVCIDVRRSGSAAIDLCNVAKGRADLYFEYRICPWDIAAGSIIVTEAGGKISQIDGSEITLRDKCSILATNGVTHMV